MSNKKKKLLRRMKIAELKQISSRPDVVEVGMPLRCPRPNHSTVQLFQRSLCSSNNNNNNNICLVKSEADLDSALSTIKGGKLSGILYYTAAWYGRCRAIAPIIEELGNKYPHVTTYKIDIDQDVVMWIDQNFCRRITWWIWK